MASLTRKCTARALVLVGAGLAGACSPEATRVRDGGAGADPGNKPVARVRYVEPKPADTTLWPGHALTALERLEQGTMYSPPRPTEAPATSAPSKDEQRTLEKSGK